MTVRITTFSKGFMLATLFLINLFLINAHAQTFNDTEGWLCDNCVDTASAEEQAVVYAPPLNCNNTGTNPFIDPDEDVECTSSPRRVILGNSDTIQIFAFIVDREEEQPWAITVQQTTLPSEMMNNATTALLFLEDWIQAIYDTNLAVNDGNTRNNTATSQSSITTRNNVPANCPDDTALAIFTDQASMDQLEVDLRNGMQDALSRLSNGGGISDVNVSVGRGSFGISFRIPIGGSPIPTAVEKFFFENENGTASSSNLDTLVFTATVAHTTSPIVDLEFNFGLSVILGLPADTLLDGNHDITDECALARLAALPSNFPNSELQIGGVPIDTSDGFPGGGSGGTGGSGTSMCTYDFFQGGQYRYSFRAPCDE